ncbi:unnamed protein product [Closterium sp. Yama58-4]|nr:unnamed protein product [Closterium sp. Yama58-4]
MSGNAILKPDIIGPGVYLIAAAPGKKPGEPGALARMSGTSMATPHLVGLAALTIQKYLNWTPAQVMSALMTTARVTGTSKSAIKSETGREATPWEMGAGHAAGTAGGRETARDHGTAGGHGYRGRPRDRGRPRNRGRPRVPREATGPREPREAAGGCERPRDRGSRGSAGPQGP